jgi:hypothetical protein
MTDAPAPSAAPADAPATDSVDAGDAVAANRCKARIVKAFNALFVELLLDCRGVSNAVDRTIKRKYRVVDPDSDRYLVEFTRGRKARGRPDPQAGAGAPAGSFQLLEGHTVEGLAESGVPIEKLEYHNLILCTVSDLFADLADGECDAESAGAALEGVLRTAKSALEGGAAGGAVPLPIDEALAGRYAAIHSALTRAVASGGAGEGAAGEGAAGEGGGDAGAYEDIVRKLRESELGKMAQSVTEGLDPAEIMRAFEAGDNTVVTDLVAKMNQKVMQKISSGELSQEDVLKSATSLLGSIGMPNLGGA